MKEKIEYQACTKCGGNGLMFNPHLNTTSSSTYISCDCCNGSKLIIKSIEKDIEDTPKLPLRELANDSDMCRDIAQLLGMRFISANWIDEKYPYVEIFVSGSTNLSYQFCIYQDGEISWEDDISIPNCLQISALILSKYEVKSL